MNNTPDIFNLRINLVSKMQPIAKMLSQKNGENLDKSDFTFVAQTCESCALSAPIKMTGLDLI